MALNSTINVGIRRFIRENGINGYRNFETNGITQYQCLRSTLQFLGVTYVKGQNLPFDLLGTSYSKLAMQQLQLYWDQQWIVPVS